jgi:NDP-sugar pyrophosphorylase family protein
MNRITSAALWKNPEASDAFAFISKYEFPWEALSHIGEMIAEITKKLDEEKYNVLPGDVWVAKSASIAPTATIIGPCIVGEDTEVRPGAFIRGNVIVGKKAVVGNSTEVKNCILFDSVQVPHFNYVGDSILGYKAHMGAGAVTSNVKSDKTLVAVKLDGVKIETGRKKFGALLGDFVEIGCNSVLNPGTIVGKNTNVYPLSSVRGYVPENSIYKSEDKIVEKVV